MFTGIVQGIATLESVVSTSEIATFTVSFPDNGLQGIEIGASVSLDGCCLTVTSTQGNRATFDLVPETLQRSALGSLAAGAELNFERSLRFGDEVGGHVLSGHVDVVAEIVALEVLHNSRNVTFRVPAAWSKYLFEKGYVALNGASLTLTRVNRATGEFGVSLIPETLAKTTFNRKAVGARINVEIDRNTQVIVETVERIMAEQANGAAR
jgi:riboflavin synthase